MKNLHLLPTDKPSVLILRQDCKLFFTGYGGQLGKIHGLRKDVPQNIYITSNEEIKEDVKQWYLDSFLNKPYNSGGAQYSSKQDVIIMTTDQDLIKDGVQAIDDEFLEWFVKNPSCDFVEVINEQYTQNYHKDIWYNRYKIIIPKEKPKQLNTEDFGLPQLGTKEFNDLASAYFSGKPKQETLEEAKKYAELSYYGDEVDAFIAGTNYQAERMYSEENMILYSDYVLMCSAEKTLKLPLQPKEWYEQFKKK